MSRYVLDTDILSLLQDGEPHVCARCAAVPPDWLTISVISVEEILASWFTSLRKAKTRPKLALAYRRLAESARFLGSLQILPFPESAIERFEQFKSLKLGVKSPDLRIGAIAVEHGATVVTRNVRDFQRIPGLSVEDWSKP
jgi:tRNA(fMet)-specific endonuclease VapC